MSLLTIYMLFCVLPSAADWISGVSFWVMLLLVAMFVVYAIGLISADSESFKEKSARLLPFIKGFSVATIFLLLLDCTMPGKDQIYTMVGAYTVTNNAEMKKLPDNIVKAANAYLEEITAQSEKEVAHGPKH